MDKKQLQSYLQNPNIQWFLYSILKYESDKVDGKINIGGHNRTSGNSSAFGSQQFIGDTRNEILEAYGVDAWSKNLEEQQLASLALLHRSNQLENAAKGDYSNINDWTAFEKEKRSRLDNRPENWEQEYEKMKSDSVYDPASSWAQIPEEMKKQKKEIFDRKYSDVDFDSITTNKAFDEKDKSDNKQIGVEEKNITTLQQSVIDNLNAKIDEQEVLGLDNEDAILKKGVEDYILSLNENELINANKLSYDDIKNQFKKPKEDYSNQKDKIQNILDNKSEYNIDVINKARLAKQNIAEYTDFFYKFLNDDSVPISKEDVDKSLVFLNELEPKQTEQEKQPAQPAREQIKPITLDPIKTVVPDTEPAEPIKQEQPLENITRLQNFLSKMKRSEGQRNINALANTAQGVTAILSAAAGIKSMIKATEKDPVSKSYVDPLFKEALLKIRQVSNQGIPYEARQSAMKDINNAYTGAMKNVMAISGGQRGLALSNIGVVDANRVNALVNLAAKDSDIRQKNLELFAKTSSDYSQQKLNANMTYDKLNSTIEENRKNR